MHQGQVYMLFAILVAFSATGLVGCVTHRNSVSSPVRLPIAFSDTGTQKVPDRWWTVFENQQLNAAIDTALESNFNLKTAWQRLRASRAVSDRESAALFPDLEAFVQGETSENQSDFETQNIRLGLSSVYEVDLWGRIRSSVEAEQYRAKATRADYLATALTLTAEIVQTWYQLAEARNQVKLVQKQIETNNKVLNLLVNRFGTGQIRSVDILRQKQLVESTREQKAYAESRSHVLEHQLAVLLGRPPQEEMTPMPQNLPELPPLPQTGVPAELVRRRPDVLRAFNLLQAADRDLASAISNQYPRLMLSASASSAANNVQHLFRDWALSIAGNLLAPIFYGGELRAEADRLEAVKQQRLYEYGQTILTAFREVEDALIREKKQMQSMNHIQQQVELATQSYQQLQNQFFNGMSNYLDVLTALDEVQRLQRDRLTSRLALTEYRIALYRALAGSFARSKQRLDGGNIFTVNR